MDDSKVKSGPPASFQYSAMNDELSSHVGNGLFGEPFGATKKRSITTKHWIIACIIFTTVIFIGFATGCIVLLAEKQSSKSDVLNQEEIYLRQDQLWQNASEILGKKIDLLRNETDDILKQSSKSDVLNQEEIYLRQDQLWQNVSEILGKKIDLLRNETDDILKLPKPDDLWQIMSDTLIKKFDLLRREVNEIVADSSQDEDQISRYIASNDRVYKFYKDRKSYTDAKATCESTGTHLVTEGVRDLDIKRELMNFVDTLNLPTVCGNNRCIWIGLTYSDTNAEWTWSDGISNSSTIDWSYNQPDPRSKNETCAVTYPENLKIHDYPCEKDRLKFYFFCEA